MGKLGQMMGLGGGMPMPSPEQIEAMQKQLGGAGFPAPPPGAPGIPSPRRPAHSTCRRSSPVSAGARNCRASAAASIRSGARRSDSRSRNGAADPARRARKRSRGPGRVLRRRGSLEAGRRPVDPRPGLGADGVQSRALGAARLWQLGARGEGDRRLCGLGRPVVSRGLPGARSRLGPHALQARARLCDGGGLCALGPSPTKSSGGRRRSVSSLPTTRARAGSPNDLARPSSAPIQHEGIEFGVYRHPSAKSLASSSNRNPLKGKPQCP